MLNKNLLNLGMPCHVNEETGEEIPIPPKAKYKYK
jgi:hypothetical protein